MEHGVIVNCEIEKGTGFGAENKVHVTYADGTAAVIFRYFPDELAFCECEFVGKTKNEALDLFHKRDVAYLQS